MNELLENQKYFIVKSAITKEVLEIARNYYQIKFFIQKDYTMQIASLTDDDQDIVKPFSIKDYADAFTESLLLKLLPTMKDLTGKNKLEPSYSYVRLYENGQWLGKHSDRPSCQYSVTLPLASHDDTPWTIFMGDNAIDLDLGDMVVYKGCEAEHWRNPFEGTWQVQAHLHYVDGADLAYAPFVNDGRPSIGMKR